MSDLAQKLLLSSRNPSIIYKARKILILPDTGEKMTYLEWRATAGSAREREPDSLECVWKERVVNREATSRNDGG